jgi:UDP-N-acetylglucosamine 4,6-dehydratase
MKDRDKKVLITGSSSFVGKFLINKILSTPDYKIIATYRNITGDYKPDNRLIFEQANLLSPTSFDSIFQKHKPDYVIHLAAMTRVKDGENRPDDTIIANYVSTQHIIDLAIKFNIKSMVVTSSNLAQDPVSVVGITKYLSEQYACSVESYKTKLVCLRMPNVIDSNDSVTNIFRNQISKNLPVTITHPDMSRMFVSGEHAAYLLFEIMNNPVNKAVYISYDDPIKIVDLAKNMIKDSGKNIEIEFIGIKSGEKIVERSFSKKQLIVSAIPGLGMLKDNTDNKNQIFRVIEKLNEREEVISSDYIQSIFAEIKFNFDSVS